jgi:activating signal cointegrator complex subunit 3
MQCHFSQLELPISDYATDLKSVLDQSIRIIQAMIDVCANSGWLSSSITCMHLLQMVMQVIIFSAPDLSELLYNLNTVCQVQVSSDYSD